MKDKVIIVTVYNSENCGSFLQAFAMMQTLTQLGYDVAFYKRDTKDSSHGKKRRLIAIKNSLIHGQIKSAYYLAKRWYDFERAQKCFKICEYGDSFYNDAQIVVFGSDTIWNFGDDFPYLREHAEILLGNVFKGKRLISYAASIGNTEEDIFQKYALQYGNLSNFTSLMVRDSHTKNVVEKVCKKNATIVCDPTLLVDRKIFVELEKGKVLGKYILIYIFEELSVDIQTEIRSFADSKGCKIFSLMKKRIWCDAFVPSSPSEMVTHFKCAEYIITNTFHGCAFSIIYQKPFAVQNIGKNKVVELLRDYGASNHMFSTSGELADSLSLPPVCKSIISAKSGDSMNNLIKALK